MTTQRMPAVVGTDIGLPGLQSSFALAVLAAAASAHVPVVLVLVHNLPVSFDELVQVGQWQAYEECRWRERGSTCNRPRLTTSLHSSHWQPANATYAPVAAIVDAWAPTMHAPVIAEAIFGLVNRWGKAVLTVCG